MTLTATLGVALCYSIMAILWLHGMNNITGLIVCLVSGAQTPTTPNGLTAQSQSTKNYYAHFLHLSGRQMCPAIHTFVRSVTDTN
jgi:hypothetical protein